MHDFVFDLLRVTFIVSVTAGLLLIVKRLFRKQLSPAMHVTLWLILFARILMLPLPTSVHSVFNYIPGYNQVTATAGAHHEHTGVATENTDNTAYLTSLEMAPLPPTSHPSDAPISYKISDIHPELATDNTEKSIVFYVFCVYLVGIFVHLARMLISYCLLISKIKRTSVECDNHIWYQKYRDIADEMHLDKRKLPKLYISTEPSMLVGIFTPILIVNSHSDERDLPMVFAHELNHFKYCDNFWIFLTNLTTAYQWFNPLIWLACRSVRDDLEILCDTRTVRIPSISTKEYAVLLYQSTCPGVVHTVRVASGISSESVLLKKRLTRLAVGSCSFIKRIISFAVCTILVVCCLTNPVQSLHSNNSVYVNNGSSLVGEEFQLCDPQQGISGIHFYNLIYTTLINKTGGSESRIPQYIGNGTLTSLTRYAKRSGMAYNSMEEHLLRISHTDAITYEQAAILMDLVIKLVDCGNTRLSKNVIPKQISENSLAQILKQLPEDEAIALLSCYNRGNTHSSVEFSSVYTKEQMDEIGSHITNDWLREKFFAFYHSVKVDSLGENFLTDNGLCTEYGYLYKLPPSLTAREEQIVRDIVSIAKTGDCEDVFYLKSRCDLYSEEYIAALYAKIGYTRKNMHTEYASLGINGCESYAESITWTPYIQNVTIENNGSTAAATAAVHSVCSYGIMEPSSGQFPYTQTLCFGEAMRALCLFYAGIDM